LLVLRAQLEALQCIHSWQVFQTARQLRAHDADPRPPNVRPLLPGARQDVDEDGLRDDVECDATKCLVCDDIAPTPDECCAHMRTSTSSISTT
jgi:hypothetical protein